MYLVVVSTYPPRRCGLAAFTADLRAALRVSAPRWRVDVCAIDRDGPRYGPEVVSVVDQDRREDYRRAAQELASAGADLVVIQHEYGIFGGPDGSYVCDLADELVALGVPYAVTLHTVLSAPNPGQAGTLARLCRSAAAVTGFTEAARALVARSGYVAPDRFVVVPHGVPELLADRAGPAGVGGAALGAALAQALRAASGHRVLSTFGLLRPGKGLETAIAAMPAVAARHPEVRYLVVGATHPETRRSRGEAYRAGLVALVRELGMAEQVRFVDAYLSEPELAALLARTDLYLTPYRSPEQTCSGALTFALGAGCPVVSTSYRYAAEVVTPAGLPPRGALVPFDDPAAFAAAVNDLLGDPDRLAAARSSARELAATLSWPAVGARFASVFASAAGPTRVPSQVRIRQAQLSELVAGAHAAAPPVGGETQWTHRLQQPPASASPAT